MQPTPRAGARTPWMVESGWAEQTRGPGVSSWVRPTSPGSSLCTVVSFLVPLESRSPFSGPGIWGYNITLAFLGGQGRGPSTRRSAVSLKHKAAVGYHEAVDLAAWPA